MIHTDKTERAYSKNYTIEVSTITPEEYTSRDDISTLYFYSNNTTFGTCTIAIINQQITNIEFDNDVVSVMQRLRTFWPKTEIRESLQMVTTFFDLVFGNHKDSETIRLLLKGTQFQLLVWQALLTIPYASVVTYKQIAEKIQNPNAIRAVGTAIGKNPVAYIIPCHRVVRGDGDISNYRWGKDIKRKMLDAERI